MWESVKDVQTFKITIYPFMFNVHPQYFPYKGILQQKSSFLLQLILNVTKMLYLTFWTYFELRHFDMNGVPQIPHRITPASLPAIQSRRTISSNGNWFYFAHGPLVVLVIGFVHGYVVASLIVYGCIVFVKVGFVDLLEGIVRFEYKTGGAG